MTLWLTEQYPFLSERREQNGVWVRPGKEDAARDLQSGDLVFIYEVFKDRDTGRTGGAKAVKFLIKVTEILRREEENWIRLADAELLAEGKCPHDDLLRILNRRGLRSLGPLNSKLIKLSETQFEQIAGYFPSYKTRLAVAEEKAVDATG